MQPHSPSAEHTLGLGAGASERDALTLESSLLPELEGSTPPTPVQSVKYNTRLPLECQEDSGPNHTPSQIIRAEPAAPTPDESHTKR